MRRAAARRPSYAPHELRCRATIHNHAARPQLTEPARNRPAADGQCCAQGGYKKEGHGDICKIVGPKVKGKKEL